MARGYPRSSFTAIDINADLFPPTNVRPRNCTFKELSVLKKLPFSDFSFDVVYCRSMIFSIPERKWQRVIMELMRVLKPGGCIELVEIECNFYRMGNYMS